MRKVFDEQLKFAQVPISDISINLQSRDEIPQILLGLQHIYLKDNLRESVFQILEDLILDDVDPTNGRPGMDSWKILVLGTLRLGCGWDYDKLCEIADNHRTLREMLGHSALFDSEQVYALQTVKDNLHRFTPEILNRINEVVIKEGHKQLDCDGKEIRGRCDSFPVLTNVHYPTDMNLLLDALRVVITTTAHLCEKLGDSSFRKSKYLNRKAKSAYRKLQKLKHSTSKKEERKQKQKEKIMNACQDYIELGEGILSKVRDLLQRKKVEIFSNLLLFSFKERIETFLNHGDRQIDQINRRIILGDKIPHKEKVFSLFEMHTEWILKGKAGVPQELGLNVCIMEDQHQFILHHHVMENETDSKIAVSMVEETKRHFPLFNTCSFDKGFHSPSNQKELKKLIARSVLPKKGRCTAEEQERENSEEFKGSKRQHSAVESAINALGHTGLDCCKDKGIKGFKRYVALAIVSRNIQRLGAILKEKELERRKRQEKVKATWAKKSETSPMKIAS